MDEKIFDSALFPVEILGKKHPFFIPLEITMSVYFHGIVFQG